VREQEPVYPTDEEIKAKMQKSFDFQVSRAQQGLGISTETGLSSNTEQALLHYAEDLSANSLAKAKFSLRLDMLGVNLDG
jgi:hypothetical protein